MRRKAVGAMSYVIRSESGGWAGVWMWDGVFGCGHPPQICAIPMGLRNRASDVDRIDARIPEFRLRTGAVLTAHRSYCSRRPVAELVEPPDAIRCGESLLQLFDGRSRLRIVLDHSRESPLRRCSRSRVRHRSAVWRYSGTEQDDMPSPVTDLTHPEGVLLIVSSGQLAPALARLTAGSLTDV